jgi:hypothetical protein
MSEIKLHDIFICKGKDSMSGAHSFSITYIKHYNKELRITKQCDHCKVEVFSVMRIKKEKSELGNPITDETAEYIIND